MRRKQWLTSRNILLVDADPDSRHQLMHMLKDRGAKPIPVADSEGVRRVLGRRPSLNGVLVADNLGDFSFSVLSLIGRIRDYMGKEGIIIGMSTEARRHEALRSGGCSGVVERAKVLDSLHSRLDH